MVPVVGTETAGVAPLERAPVDAVPIATAAVETAVVRAREHLLGLQSPDGWWRGEFEGNITTDAEDLLFREFLGIRTAEQTEQTARWIRTRQGADGWWSNFYGGPPDLSTTVEGYVALRLAGDPVDAEHMRRAAAFIREQGGIGVSRVYTRTWLALFGEWPWEDLPVMPPEFLLLPPWSPFSMYDFAAWARQTIVPLALILSLRPVRRLGFTLAELRVDAAPVPFGWPGSFGFLGVVFRGYERAVPVVGPLRVIRRAAVARATEWILKRQEADGSWGGLHPPWVCSIMALHVLGYPLEHPVLAAGLRGLERYTVVENRPGALVRRVEAAQSPVWDTALSVTALVDSGLPLDDSALHRAVRWLLGEEIRVAGDWAVRRPGLAPGCWAFEFDNDWYPDTDTTAAVVVALRRAMGFGSPGAGSEVAGAVERGVAWVVGMRSRDSGWGAFDADNTRVLPTKLPFCDFGDVTDPPSVDVTAHVMEMFAEVGRADDEVTHRGVDWLLANQEPDGSWFGRWGVNHVYGTGAVVPALIAAGVRPEHPAIRRAVRWLTDHQLAGGGWGEDPRSYRDSGWVGRGGATASQTAWALLALLAADPRSAAVERGVRWLVETQRPDGTWDEPFHTGSVFPRTLGMARYHLYRHVFPLTALGRFVASRTE